MRDRRGDGYFPSCTLIPRSPPPSGIGGGPYEVRFLRWLGHLDAVGNVLDNLSACRAQARVGGPADPVAGQASMIPTYSRRRRGRRCRRQYRPQCREARILAGSLRHYRLAETIAKDRWCWNRWHGASATSVAPRGLDVNRPHRWRSGQYVERCTANSMRTVALGVQPISVGWHR
jgi:hypothetical protein